VLRSRAFCATNNCFSHVILRLYGSYHTSVSPQTSPDADCTPDSGVNLRGFRANTGLTREGHAA
jgi:hypothetical protein